MTAYFQSIGQPVPQITDVLVDGTKNNPNQGVGSADDSDCEGGLNIQSTCGSLLGSHRTGSLDSRLLVTGHRHRSAEGRVPAHQIRDEEVLTRGRHDLNQRHHGLYSIQRVPEPLPLVVATPQRANAFDA